MNIELGFEMYLTYLKRLKQNGLFLMFFKLYAFILLTSTLVPGMLFLINEVFDYLFQCSVVITVCTVHTS